MSMDNLTELLGQAAEEVLENMFFSGVLSELAEEPGGDRLCATVRFEGSSHGELRLSTSASSAALLAAGFLGTEDENVPGAQAREVAGELANVLCGVVLGRLNPQGNFVISPPEVANMDGVGAVSAMQFQKRFEIMEGDLAVGLTVRDLSPDSPVTG